MTSTLLNPLHPAREIAVAGLLGPGVLAHRRDFEERPTGKTTFNGKTIEVTTRFLVTACTQADARGLSYGWASTHGAVPCPTCFPTTDDEQGEGL